MREEIDGAKRHYADKERCVFCDIVRQELGAGRRLIHENADIVALAPYASRVPFETWLMPRNHASRFETAPRHVFESLARMLKWVMARLDRALEVPPYNLIIHNAPFSEETSAFFHWHVELMPRIARLAGFEWGSGFYINPTSPEEAAEVLRRSSCPDARVPGRLNACGPYGSFVVRASGNNSVVECDLPRSKSRVRISVSRSNIFAGALASCSARFATWAPLPTRPRASRF